MAFCTYAKLNSLCVVSSATALTVGNGRGRKVIIVPAATTTGGGGTTSYEEGKLERPRWTGETSLSRLVGALISFKPLFSVLKLGARQVLISGTAEKTNIPWREMTREILQSEVYKEMDSIQNSSIVYPDYYLNPFHAYDEGNLSWLKPIFAFFHKPLDEEAIKTDDKAIVSRLQRLSAVRHWHKSFRRNPNWNLDFLIESCMEAKVQKDQRTLRTLETACDLDLEANPVHPGFWLPKKAAAEAEAATMSMVRRAIPDASSLDEANQIVRGNWLKAIEQHHHQFSGNTMIKNILDIGCSVGVSSRYLADKFSSAKVTGLDLSPYFLAVAQFKEKASAPRTNPISWVHANGEDTGLPAKSCDVVSIAYVLHECPNRAIVNLVKEAFRLLRPGGTFAVTDNSPKSKILQELSPVLFTLMKSTEPFLDEYYLTDLEGTMREVGFVNVRTVLTDPRHRTVTATVPY
ncbi:Demethylmenaquinone methyltransferase [Actinidia chinensis var. chinensis]|uniref:Demethylmenaquinone methyltransferase n=1 Tax=Actinidia chinensis var. chinensis TaxID=1590841 RepID=A0A2R6PQR4_ACTCC|nr:Demethylmenaquinone methyltransferase [Actinidia chinensis var. chinensis]